MNNPTPSSAAGKTALAYLTHPFSLAAAGLLLLNDAVLRRLWPSWWTGKLGDLAWLFFVPFIAAAIVSWVLPCPKKISPSATDERLLQRHRRWSFGLGYAFTGLAFGIVKTVPAVNALAIRYSIHYLGLQPALRLDPSDLLALVGWLLSALWWLAGEKRRSPGALKRFLGAPAAHFPLLRLAALPFVLLVLLADAAAPDTGITCFSRAQGKIVAKAGYQSYQSSDGGLTWQIGTPGGGPACTPAVTEPGQWRTVPGSTTSLVFRYQSGAEIQQSTDGGKTWQTAYRPPPVTQAEQTYLLRSHAGNPIYEPGPLDAIADPASGNMLFAMGLRGVLLHTPQDEWLWSMSGTYRPPGSFPSADAYAVLLGGMLLLAVGLALLIYALLALRWTRRWPRIVVLALAVLVWLGVDVLFPPAISNSYTLTASNLGLLALAILILPLVIEQTIRLARRAPRALPALAGISLAGGLVYCIPYLLWLYNLLPDFGTVTGVALAAAMLILVLGLVVVRSFPRVTPAALLLLAFSLLALSACGSAAPSLAPRGAQRWVPAGSTLTPFQPQASPQPTSASAAPTDTLAPTGRPTPTGPQLQVVYRSGQTFLTWTERADLRGERYRIYRSNRPITANNYTQASRLVETGKNSARFYASMFVEDNIWKYRYASRLITHDNGDPTPEGVGLLVCTLSAEDFGGQSAGNGYYAVTITPAGGKETFSAAYTSGPVKEAVADPLPVEITHSPGTVTKSAQSHVYVQYMDLRHWNPTFHAPNVTNQFYGFNPADSDLAAALAYAYDYQVFTPTPDDCGGQIPNDLPVMLFLHGARTNRYGSVGKNPYPHCAYSVYPIDQSDTWYFGFARRHDYRLGGVVAGGDVIENYTERRVLRMLYDLMRKPPGPAVDRQRVYVFGHSMGGSGTLGFVERYPNVFAAGYSGEPISNYRTSGVTKGDWVANVSILWGAPALNLPVHIDAPNGWASPIQKYDGLGVWDWQNYLGNLTGEAIPGRLGDEMAPFGIDHGINDDVILWPTQGQAFYPRVAQSPRVWSGAVTPAKHEWSDFGYPLPSLAKVGKEPFWNLQVKRDESLPALSHLSSNLPGLPTAPTTYNQTVKWSSSWDPWDKAPVDKANHWQMSFCAVKPGSTDCGTGQPVTASITPRRLQQFKVQPGVRYDWENRQVSNNLLVAKGTVTAGADGLVTVPGFRITPTGSRLVLRPHKP